MKRLLRILILIVVSGNPAICQVPYFQEYFLLRKNEAIQVNSILQDKKGHMWIATSLGLFIFDAIIIIYVVKFQVRILNYILRIFVRA